MEIGRFNISLTSYLGKIDNGVLALLSIIYDEETYEGTYWYKELENKQRYDVLTIDYNLYTKLGNDINKEEEYEDLINYLKEKSMSYNKGISELDNYKPS